MMDAAAANATETAPEAASAAAPRAETFDELDQAFRSAGAGAVLDQVIAHLGAQRKYRALLDALLLKARHELGLSLIQEGSLSELAEPVRSEYEARYVEAIRAVGTRLLESGDIAGAWPYFRAIGETEPVAHALESYAPPEQDERVGAVIDVAFNQRANPRRGFELILEHYGTCSAITAFEHLASDEVNRVACADRLVARLHEELVANLRAEIAQRGQPLPAEGAPIGALLEGRPWLFAEDAYHIDLSHLSAVVRIAPLLVDRGSIAKAVGLTDYGRCLSPRHRAEGEPPFDDHYEDHRAYLRALLAEDVEAALGRFRAKLQPASGDEDAIGQDTVRAAQVLVGLLLRLGRLDEAIDVAAAHLAELPESALGCPSVAQLCQRAGQPGRLARIARAHGDLVHYAAAILQGGTPGE